jgi:hypothetical protein
MFAHFEKIWRQFILEIEIRCDNVLIRKKSMIVCSTMLRCPMIVVFDVSVLRLARRLLEGGVIGRHALRATIHLDHLHGHPSSFTVVEDIVLGGCSMVQHVEEGRLQASSAEKNLGQWSIVNYGSAAPMTNEVLQFVWRMTKIEVIKPGSPRVTHRC